VIVELILDRMTTDEDGHLENATTAVAISNVVSINCSSHGRMSLEFSIHLSLKPR